MAEPTAPAAADHITAQRQIVLNRLDVALNALRAARDCADVLRGMTRDAEDARAVGVALDIAEERLSATAGRIASRWPESEEFAALRRLAQRHQHDAEREAA